MKQSLQFAFAVAALAASGLVFAQSTPQTSPPKTQVAQGKGGSSAGAGQTKPVPPAPAAAPLGLPAAVAGTLTALGAASTNDNTTPPQH